MEELQNGSTRDLESNSSITIHKTSCSITQIQLKVKQRLSENHCPALLHRDGRRWRLTLKKSVQLQQTLEQTLASRD